MSGAAGGAQPFWRAAGMTYVAYANTCAALVRKCLKEPFKTQAATREQVHYKFVQWVDGTPQKAVTRSTASVTDAAKTAGD